MNLVPKINTDMLLLAWFYNYLYIRRIRYCTNWCHMLMIIDCDRVCICITDTYVHLAGDAYSFDVLVPLLLDDAITMVLIDDSICFIN